jgi:NAD(P)-dependent dehydrogenase (short-subunit alcohol dehydrogenase family)
MGALEGRVVVITGAGRGIGREHALLFAAEGAAVVVNDLGGTTDGVGADRGAAQDVADEINSSGGQAIANADDITDFAAAKRLIDTAAETFGRLDVLVNNAGILRDGFLAGMDEGQWDAVINVHLKGHFAPMRHAAQYWKNRAKQGEDVRAAIINTTSISGTVVPNPGQTNYGAAKAGIAALTLVAAQELQRYGVRVNAIAPMARTRMADGVPILDQLFAKPEDPEAFDIFHPSNVSPLVAYLATKDCPITGQVFTVQGGTIQQLVGWRPDKITESTEPWTIDDLATRIGTWS